MNQPYLVAFGGWTCEVHIQYHVMEEKGVETGEDLPAILGVKVLNKKNCPLL